MPIPKFQDLIRPTLECTAGGEVRISDVVARLGKKLNLSQEEMDERLPKGSQPKFTNRVHWARTYLKQAGLVRATRHAHIEITDLGRKVLADNPETIDETFLKQFQGFLDFRNRAHETQAKSIADEKEAPAAEENDTNVTPDEILRSAYQEISAALAAELLDRAREATPAFFERLIVELLLAMGYGGTSENAGKALGKSGDDGIDGVIDQDPLGVDQIYIQAKRYAEKNTIGPDAIRDFFGALDIKNAHKGIFVTTSSFSKSAVETAENLSARIVLIDGAELAHMMFRYNIGCRYEQTFHLKKIDEDFFE